MLSLRHRLRACAVGVFVIALCLAAGAHAQEILPSWNDGDARHAIIAFVEDVTDESSPNFVPGEARIATFDNDGTLWVEQPMYTQLVFAIDRVKAMAAEHPEWSDQQPFAAILADDHETMASFTHKDISAILAASHAGMTTEEFSEVVRQWLETARHPRFDRPYTELVYQPMLELLTYLRANGFKTYIVSGGGIEFMRVFADQVYGIPPEQVIGSSGKLKFEMQDGVPVLVKQPEINSIDDGPGKPENIQLFIGRRPVMAFGNSDGDQEMLEWTTIGQSPSFGLLVHHTDAVREYAYDRDSHVGKLDTALDAAPEYGWTIVSMRTDWKTIFPEED